MAAWVRARRLLLLLAGDATAAAVAEEVAVGETGWACVRVIR